MQLEIASRRPPLATLPELHWGTLYRAVGAEYAAVAGQGLEQLMAALALVEELAGIGGHSLLPNMPAMGAGDFRR